MRKICLLIIGILLSMSLSCQILNFRSYKSSSGLLNKEYCVYTYGAWGQDNTNIVIDLTRKTVIIGNRNYEIIEPPCSWIVKRYFKYTNMSCTDESCSKVQIRLYIYDKKKYCKVVVMDEKKSTRYVVIQK